MTFEERIDRLTERHEALAQSLELFDHFMSERMREFAAKGQQLEDILTELGGKVTELAWHMGQLAVSMAHLSETTINHERRIQNVEGGRA